MKCFKYLEQKIFFITQKEKFLNIHNNKAIFDFNYKNDVETR